MQINYTLYRTIMWHKKNKNKSSNLFLEMENDNEENKKTDRVSPLQNIFLGEIIFPP